MERPESFAGRVAERAAAVHVEHQLTEEDVHGGVVTPP